MIISKLNPFTGRDGRDGDRGPIGQQGYVIFENIKIYSKLKKL